MTQQDRNWRILCDIAGAVFMGIIFYAVMVLLGWGENPRIGETVTVPNAAVAGTFILAWVASLKKFRGMWHWSVLQGLLFLVVGAFAIWMSCGGSDHEGYYSYFQNTWTDFGLATAMIFGPALAGLMCGGIHYALRRKKT